MEEYLNSFNHAELQETAKKFHCPSHASEIITGFCGKDLTFYCNQCIFEHQDHEEETNEISDSGSALKVLDRLSKQPTCVKHPSTFSKHYCLTQNVFKCQECSLDCVIAGHDFREFSRNISQAQNSFEDLSIQMEQLDVSHGEMREMIEEYRKKQKDIIDQEFDRYLVHLEMRRQDYKQSLDRKLDQMAEEMGIFSANSQRDWEEFSGTVEGHSFSTEDRETWDQKLKEKSEASHHPTLIRDEIAKLPVVLPPNSLPDIELKPIEEILTPVRYLSPQESPYVCNIDKDSTTLRKYDLKTKQFSTFPIVNDGSKYTGHPSITTDFARKKWYFSGGSLDGQLTSNLWSFDVETEKINYLAPLMKASARHGFTSSPDDMLYVIGGGSFSYPTKECYRYSINLNRWKQIESLPNATTLNSSVCHYDVDRKYCIVNLCPKTSLETLLVYNVSMKTFSFPAKRWEKIDLGIDLGELSFSLLYRWGSEDALIISKTRKVYNLNMSYNFKVEELHLLSHPPFSVVGGISHYNGKICVLGETQEWNTIDMSEATSTQD